MTQLSNAKIFGGIGAILSLLAFIPTIGFIISIIGFVLILIAVNNIAQATKDNSIFNNFLYNVILTIIAFAAVVAIFFILIGGITGIMDMVQLIQQNQGQMTDPTQFFAIFGQMLTAIILALFVGWILLIIAAVFLKKSYNKITEHTKVNLFKTTGLVYLIGAATLIIGIGFLILIIAKIMEIIAFFTLPETLPSESVPTPTPTTPPPET